MPVLTVSKNDTGLTAREFLLNKIPAAAPGYLNQLFKKGRVSRAGSILSAETEVAPGDCIQLPESARILELLEQSSTASPGLEILFESREILILNKPAGLAVHTGKGHENDNLTDRTRSYFSARRELFQLSPIQRLDLETSGPVLFGKGKKSCSELGKLFMKGEVTKVYLALVMGHLPDHGTLSSDIPAKGKIKTASTSFRKIAGNQQTSLLEVKLETGRQHQIRRQFAEAGHPLYGDRRYRGPCPKELQRLFLHCRKLAFTDPFSNQPIAVEVALPTALLQFLEQHRLAVAI